MDGRTLSRKLARVLREDPDTSGFVDPRTTFDLLFQAVAEYVARTQCLHAVDTITTVAGTKDYLLAADYLGMYMRDGDDYAFVRYTPAGGTGTNIRETTEAKAFENNLTANAATPGGFYVTDYRTARANVTGTATATGSVSAGKTVLSGTGFTGYVSAGDAIHNTTKASDGVVTSVTSNTQLNCALFGGTAQFFTITTDTYVIVPQGRFQLSLDAPPAATGDTIQIPYVKRPDPVYSDFESYNLPVQDDLPLVCYAAFLYKYRDQEPNFGDRYFLLWDRAVRLAGRQRNKALGRTGWKAIFKK